MAKPKEIDFNKLKMTFQNMENDKGILGLKLLEESEFMKTTLDNLKKAINDKGVVTEMCQGKYSIERANPALSQYNALIKNYQSNLKQLNDLLPSFESSNDDGFDNDDL